MPSRENRSGNAFLNEEKRREKETYEDGNSSWKRGDFQQKVNWTKCYRNSVRDMRCYRYDKRGKLIQWEKDEKVVMVHGAFHIAGTDDDGRNELIEDGTVVPILVSGCDHKKLTPVIADILAPVYSLNMTIAQANLVASTLTQLYDQIGVKHTSPHGHALANHGSVAKNYKKAVETRLLHRIEKVPVSESEDEDAGEVVRDVAAKNAAYLASMAEAKKEKPATATSMDPQLVAQITALLSSLQTATPGVPGASPNPAEKKRQRPADDAGQGSGGVQMQDVQGPHQQTGPR